MPTRPRAALFALAMTAFVLSGIPSSAAPPPLPDPSLSLYDQALLAHTSLEPKLRGEAIENGATLEFGPDGQVQFVQAADATAATTTGVTQNGICNDQKPEAQVDDTRVFWVHNFKLNMDIQKTFILAAKTPHVYMWVDITQFDPTNATSTGPTTSRAEAEAGAAAFETIYDVDRAYFGEPARCDQLPFRQPPRMEDIWGSSWYDADDDPHINIVNFDPDVGATVVAGYYSSADEYPQSVNAHSNEGEFFYMNSLLFDPGTGTYDSILAHEFYHMIQFANDANEETWVNEGMADVAIEVNGFASFTSSHTSDYAITPEDQLTNWDGQLYDYGNAYSFFSYFLEHYGPADDPATAHLENYALADDITKFANDGMAGIDDILASNPFAGGLDPYYQGNTANDVYLDRGVANIVNDRSIGAGQWGYGTLSSFRVQPHGEFSTYPQSDTVDDALAYGDHLYVFDSLGDGMFSLSSQSTIPIVANTPPSGTHELWSNRSDETETFAVREADLTGATNPHLRFMYWYDIEEDFDYAYLQVSEDGGLSWTNLACCGARNTNPNGNNRGNGITGISQSTPLDLEPQYVQADVDLSAYAGKSVLVRFLYVTDPAVLHPGLTLDDIELVDGGATIWPLEDFEAGPGAFTLGGTSKTMLVVEPDIANELSLQLVKLGPEVTVERPPATGGGSGLTAQGAMDAQRTIAIVSSLTPITSETFEFSYDANASAIEELTPPTLFDPGETVKRNQKFTLRWTPAGNAGTRSPTGYRVQEATINTSHLSDDAESGLGNWTTSTTGTGAVGWQTSEVKSNSPAHAFWASASEGAIDTAAIMTLDGAIQVPSGATTELRFWDWHVNESDDSVRVEVSADGGQTWQAVYQAGRSALAPDAAVALETEPMNEQSVDLSSFAGQTLQLRFRFQAGSANRPGSTPFGWYVDDVSVSSANWTNLAVVDGTSFRLSKRTAGTFFYRVAAIYTATFEGPFSNVVDIRVTGGR
jgi:immune inhibitor A